MARQEIVWVEVLKSNMPVYDVLQYGAAGDGATNDAPAIQRTIDACTASGGGTVLFPAGRTYLSGSFRLQANVELYLESGATLLASPHLEDYPPGLNSEAVSGGRIRENELPTLAFIIAYQADNISFKGPGVIDGNGRSFVAEDLGHIYRMKGDKQYLQRPFTIFLIGCDHLDFDNITVRDGAFWTIRLAGCEDIRLHGVRILNDLKLPNNDGIDLDCCRNVRISDCHVMAGDDAICLKTCRAMVEAGFGPCENVTVTGCSLMSTSAALKIGNECRAPIRNVIFDACVVRSSNRGLSIHLSESGDVENILFSNLILETRLFHEAWWGRGEPIFVSAIPWDEARSSGGIRHVRFSNILARSENGVFVGSNAPGHLDDIHFENVRIHLEKWSKWPGGRQDLRPCEGEGLPAHSEAGFFLMNAARILLRDCEVAWGINRSETYGYALESHAVTGLEYRNFRGDSAQPARYPPMLIDANGLS